MALEAWRGRNYSAERFWQADLVCLDEVANAFYYDALVALEVSKILPETDYTRIRLLDILERAIAQIDYSEPIGDAFYASLVQAQNTLRELLAAEQLAPNAKRCAPSGTPTSMWPGYGLWPKPARRRRAPLAPPCA
ncbi:MAG: hypothetical protein GXY52_02540 [Chloroflexi bacterium]|nr:hypothetical protein [Chloroflexota bacterium]